MRPSGLVVGPGGRLSRNDKMGAQGIIGSWKHHGWGHGRCQMTGCAVNSRRGRRGSPVRELLYARLVKYNTVTTNYTYKIVANTAEQ